VQAFFSTLYKQELEYNCKGDRTRMTSIAFVGPPRTGKTLFMTFHGYMNQQAGHEIFANYKLSFPHTLMSPYDMLKIPFNDVDRHPKTLLISEASKWFEARRSMRNENVLLSSLTGQAGKRNLDIFIDDQYFERIERELRRSMEYIYHCMVYVDSKTKIPLAFEYHREDMYSGQYFKLPIIPATVLEPFYSMYDTYAPTIPMTVGKTMKELDTMYRGKKKNAKQAST